MKNWFESLEQRERLFVIVGALAVVVTILWAGIWLPLDKGHRDAAARVASWERSLSELRPLAAAPAPAEPQRSGPRPGSALSPVVIIDNSLRARQLGQPKRSQPTPNGIRVEFENVAFDDLVLWLGDLSSQYGLDVQAGSLSTSSVAGPGRINASLTLERTL